ncbi:glycosyltransferase family 2 protein [Leptolyngbya sp. FACHB-321]|uniref:glycosyltransferase family 2 protein n=1 Tax=Leptolyngbya sp. FACHB-321 TaxID=2692807 RepID=UPI0016876B0E|nr:glycosyltransferase family A protein [Leptolyngbya sp. FACHB-321]MBD2034642.1 glycosyltransferase family 2 protein [Leptolyngbya sp. FACHB-321]
MTLVDVLIPTCNRPTALAVTLTSLIAQTFQNFRIVISDQTEGSNPLATGEVQAVLRVLQAHGHSVDQHKHLPRWGIAEQRQFLLDQAIAPYVLYLDDDVILEANVIQQLLSAIQTEGCGFVGNAMHGLSFHQDVRPHEQAIEFWQGAVQPELVRPDTPQWERWRLHNAANLYHVQQRLGLAVNHPRKYKVAWVAGCVLYDADKLRGIGGFNFWRDLPPEHGGEDVRVQLELMARYGGCGLIPSGAYHQEVPTTIPDRLVAADNAIDWSTEQPFSRK